LEQVPGQQQIGHTQGREERHEQRRPPVGDGRATGQGWGETVGGGHQGVPSRRRQAPCALWEKPDPVSTISSRGDVTSPGSIRGTAFTGGVCQRRNPGRRFPFRPFRKAGDPRGSGRQLPLSADPDWVVSGLYINGSSAPPHVNPCRSPRGETFRPATTISLAKRVPKHPRASELSPRRPRGAGGGARAWESAGLLLILPVPRDADRSSPFPLPPRESVMPTLIATPTRIQAAGNKPKLIDEYVGRVNSREEHVSIAHMRSPAGWVEPGQA